MIKVNGPHYDRIRQFEPLLPKQRMDELQAIACKLK